MAGPDISLFASLLRPIEIAGPFYFIYAYVDENGRCEAGEFLDELRQRDKAAYSRYRVAMTMFSTQGRATGEKWHMLDPKRPPYGILKDDKGDKLSLSGMGEFKNVPHQSRIFHITEPDRLIVLLTVFREKKENELTALSVNPALRMRQDYCRRKAPLLARRGR